MSLLDWFRRDHGAIEILPECRREWVARQAEQTHRDEAVIIVNVTEHSYGIAPLTVTK